MNPEIKNDEHKCDCKCSFGDIIPKIMKFNLGEIIAFAAVFFFLIITIFSGIPSNKTFYFLMLALSKFTFILFLILFFAEKFSCFNHKHLKLINTVILGISSVCFAIWTFFQWNTPSIPESYFPKALQEMLIFSPGFSIESLILFILILAANAYWAYDIIIGFLAKQKEEAAKKEAEEAKKAAEEPKKEEVKVEEKPAEEPAKEEEKPEENVIEEKVEEEETKDDEVENEDDDEDV